MKVTAAALAIVFMSGTMAYAQSGGGTSGSSSGSPSSSSTNSGVVNPVLPRSQNPQTAPAPSDSAPVGRSPGTNPANPQDLTNRSNPQDLTLPGANNPQDMTTGVGPNIPSISVEPKGPMPTGNQSRSNS